MVELIENKGERLSLLDATRGIPPPRDYAISNAGAGLTAAGEERCEERQKTGWHPVGRGRFAALAAARFVAAERHAGAGGEGDAIAFCVGHGAFHEADCLASLDDSASGDQTIVPDGLEEIDFQLERGEGFTFFERRSV